MVLPSEPEFEQALHEVADSLDAFLKATRTIARNDGRGGVAAPHKTTHGRRESVMDRDAATRRLVPREII